MYTIRTTVTTTTIGTVIAQLWNPHATARITVVEFFILFNATPGADSAVSFVATNTRGTPGSTDTPSIIHHSQCAIAPPSGVLLDKAPFSVMPAVAGDLDTGWYLRVRAGSGILRRINHLIVPGHGLGLWQLVATAGYYDLGFSWYEESAPIIISGGDFPTVQRPQ